MKSKSPAFTILSVLLFAAVVVYFAFEIVNYVKDPIKTALVYHDTIEETIPLNGYIVRDEEAFTSSCNALSHAQKEGAKVGVGQVLAMGYNSTTALGIVDEIAELELQLEQLDFAMESLLDSDAALRLDGDITSSIIVIHQESKNGEYTVENAEVSQLKASILKRDSTMGSQEEIEAEANRVREEIQKRENSLGGATRITAPQSGTFSALCDGYEQVLTMEFLEEATPESFDSIPSLKTDETYNVGKLIYGDTWYYMTTCDIDTAKLVQKMGTVRLRFAKGFSGEVKMQVDHVSEEQDGQQVVVFKSDKFLAKTTLMRTQSADIIVKEYEGLRIPTNAIRVNEEGESGVFCVIGINARFKPISVVWSENDYSLVEANTASDGTVLLRAGDEVIISKGDLYDGKVISR